ncbi:ABC transporter permease [Microvirgula aerodenitrificans]|uniref:MlaE family ABC transporter permease n=1 Tax=Microvirgula aerodenitrificans TaxID=57480 RepID=UPI0028E94DBD|nr:ABC transporter permease [Microvirgula aerodenitrificans]
MNPPGLKVDTADGTLTLLGDWTRSGLSAADARFRERLEQAAAQAAGWNLDAIGHLDSCGAALLWQVWGQRWPQAVTAAEPLRVLLARLAALPPLPAPPGGQASGWRILPVFVGDVMLTLCRQLRDVTMLFGQLLIASGWILRYPVDMPWRGLSANLFRVGVKALGITALVGFLIGIVLSYLSAQQLARYGANILVVDLLGVGILRELGPMLAAILVAGRSGSAITAELGVMKIRQELDAMLAMGLSPNLSLVWPRVVALIIAMPLVALWTDVMALIGGALAAWVSLDLPLAVFIDRFPTAVAVKHLYLGLGKSLVFGALIGLVACRNGLSVAPNSESLGAATTRAVVVSITLVILADAVFAILFSPFQVQ